MKERGLFVELGLLVYFCFCLFFKLFFKDGCVFVFQDVGVIRKKNDTQQPGF